MKPEIDLSQTHHELLILMSEIHDVLVNNGINYSLTGGSLLIRVLFHGMMTLIS